MVVLVLKKCESYLYNESQFHIKYNNLTNHVLYIGIYPQYCIENISTQKKQDPIQRSYPIKPVAEADVLINIPKLKTHGTMVYTGAIKNMFGLIAGIKKTE